MKEKLTIGRGEDGLAFIVGRPFSPLVPHHHDELEVNLVLSGQARYLFGAQCISLQAGSMIWLFPRQEHVLVDQSPDFCMWVLVFTPRLVARRARAAHRAVLRQADPRDIFCRGIEPHRAAPLQAVYENAAVKDDLALRNAALDYALMASWNAFQASPATLREADVHPAVARAARLTAESDTPLTLAQLARQAGLSAPRLSRLFKLQTGTSLTAFRQRKCLEHFLRLYGTGARYTLLEAALLAGFGSYPQFHRVFCRLMKMNPAAYRRRLAAR
jgi:AraC-like DNA-binding protein